MSELISLLIVIPSHNRPRTLSQSLRSILLQSIPPRLSLKILVRENSSCPDAKKAILELIEDISTTTHVPINVLNVSDSTNCLEADLNIYESIRTNESDYVYVLPDDDFLLAGSIDKIFRAIDQFKPQLIRLGLIEVDDSNSEYII